MEPLSGGSRSPSDKGGRSSRPCDKGGRSAAKIFSALGASFWSKNKGDRAPWAPPRDLSLPLPRVLDMHFEAILPSLKSL